MSLEALEERKKLVELVNVQLISMDDRDTFV